MSEMFDGADVAISQLDADEKQSRKIHGALSDYELLDFKPDHAKEVWEVMMVDGRVKVLVQYRQGEAEDIAKIKRCLELIINMENTTIGKEDPEEAAHRR